MSDRDLHSIQFEDEVDGRNLNYLTLELIETLTARIGRPNETGATLNVLTDVAEALSRSHAVGIVHRDLYLLTPRRSRGPDGYRPAWEDAPSAPDHHDHIIDTYVTADDHDVMYCTVCSQEW